MAQKIGIWAHNGTSTYSGVLCGFNCSNVNNTSVLVIRTIDANGRSNRFGINVSGRKNKLGLLVLSAGLAKKCRTGVTFPGIKNVLLASFPTLIVSSGSLSGTYRAACGGGFTSLLPTLSIPSSAKGATVTFQGVVTDDADGRPAFTRAIQVTFR
jgi:hypothetical protein